MSNLTIDIGRCKELVDLEIKKTRLEAEVKKVTREIEALWAPILLDMVRSGVRSVPLKSGVRLQPYRTLFCNKASGVPKQMAIRALEDAGLGYIVEKGYAPGKLKEWLREREDGLKEEGRGPPDDINNLLPKILRDFFKVTEKNSVTVVGAKALSREESHGEEERSDSEG